MSSSGLVTIDGSKGEGGGQVLRTALTLSMITGRPFRVTKIRANREQPGLRPQHLAAVEASARLCGAEVMGGSVGSRDMTFRPGPVEARDFEHAIGTAGSTALVLQTIHLPIALAAQKPIRVMISGGTFNTRAPSFPFLAECWRRHMADLGMPVALSMPAAGFYPKGGGRLEAWIEPARPRPRNHTERGRLLAIWGVAGVCRLHHNEIPQRMRAHAESLLKELTEHIQIDSVEWPGPAPGAAIALTAEYANGHATFVGLGERGKPAETVTEEAAGDLLEHHDSAGAVDSYSADQILLPLALANGSSVYTVTEVTEHLRTNARTIAMFLDRGIRIEEARDDEPGRVIIS